MIWDTYRCPFCGGTAEEPMMSLIARCRCGARRASTDGILDGHVMASGEWLSPPWFVAAEGAD